MSVHSWIEDLDQSGYTSSMKTAAVTDLKNRLSHYLRLVARGETVTVLDRGKPVAQLTPPGDASGELQQLAQAGLARLPIRKPGRDLWTRPLPKAATSVTEALLEDRDDRLS
jgi:prevent-host-death family protein